MNEFDSTTAGSVDDGKPEPPLSRKLIWSILAILLGFTACCFQPGRTLLFGWIEFAMRVLPEVQVNWSLVLIGIVSFAGIVFLIHHLGDWLLTQRPQSSGQGKWRFRSSLSISLLIVVMFCAGLAAVGITHQTAWLIRSPKPWMVQKIGSGTHQAENLDLQHKLRSVDLGIHNYGAQFGRLPFAAHDDQEIQQSWPSRIVGTMYSTRKLTRFPDLAWDHDSNRDYYTRVFPDLLNPTLENAPQHDEEGYGVSHFEMNENMKNFNYKEYEDGTSTIIMIGEVRSNFQPWGKPNTHRSLELGLNRHPNGFGGPPSRDSVMFLLMDGSVRTISDTVDPEVLRALSGAKQ